MFKAYKDSWEQIVKPPRFDYYVSDLGPPIFHVGDSEILRHDFSIETKENLKIKASYYCKTNNPSDVPCVIYLHTHSGNRIEGQFLVNKLLPRYTFCSFDFTGCG